MKERYVLHGILENSSKIDLPETALEEIANNGELESPLVFRVTGPGGTTHAGVHQFSAPSESILVGRSLGEAVGALDPGTPVEVELVNLPKGTGVKLKADDPTVDWKALLERFLPQYCTALTQGDILKVPHLGKVHSVRVLSLEPASAVCIVDTDLDLEVEAPVIASDGQRHYELDDTVPLKEYAQSIDIPDEKQIVIECEGLAYIGPENATVQDRSYLWMLCGSNKLTLTDPPRPLWVCGEGTVRVYLNNAAKGTKECPTCGRRVPENSWLLHTSFCARHTARCNDCGKAFPNREVPVDHWHCECGSTGEGWKEKHMATHSPDRCECGYATLVGDVARHRARDCPLRLKICRFCHLLVPQGETQPHQRLMGLTAHEDECGSRTADCPFCGKPVLMRSLPAHIDGHDNYRRSKPQPVMCANRNCPHALDPTAVEQPPLGLCRACYGPLYARGQHDPDGSRLAARVERRYILQLTRGCGHSWCQNHLCATGSGRKLTIAEAMACVKSLPQGEYFFCVDEIATRKAMFVSFDDGEYSRNWRGMAISRCASEAEARKWLEFNAAKINE